MSKLNLNLSMFNIIMNKITIKIIIILFCINIGIKGKDSVYTPLVNAFAEKIEKNNVIRISIGNFVYQNSDAMSAYSALLQNELREIFGKSDKFKIIARENFSEILKEKRFQTSDIMSPTSKATKISIDGIDGVIRGRFFFKYPTIKLFVELLKLDGGEILTESLEVSAENVKVDIEPGNFTECFNNYKSVKTFSDKIKNQFDVSLSTLQSKTNYCEDETINFKISSSKNCKIALLCHQADGSTILLYPNKLSANTSLIEKQIMNIPNNENSDFDIVVSPPFGSDVIQVIACNEQSKFHSKLENIASNMPYGQTYTTINRDKFMQDLLSEISLHSMKWAQRYIVISTYKK